MEEIDDIKDFSSLRDLKVLGLKILMQAMLSINSAIERLAFHKSESN